MNKAQQDFNTSFDEFKNAALSPAIRYLELLTENGGVTMGSDDFITLVEFVKRAIQQNKNYLVKYAIEQGFEDWNIPLEEYAAKGNKEMVNFYFNISPNSTLVQLGALKGGHIDLFRDIMKNPKSIQVNMNNSGFGEAAVESGQEEVVKTFALISELNGEIPNTNDLLKGAVKSGNKGLFNYIRSLMSDELSINWSFLLDTALESGNREFFDYLQTLIPPNTYNISSGTLIPVLHSGNVSLFDYIVSLIPHDELQNIEWDVYAIYALKSGKKALLDRVLNLARSISPNYNWNWSGVANTALKSGNKYLFDYIRSLIPPNYPLNWNVLLSGAIYSGNRKLVDYIKSLVPQDFYPNCQTISNLERRLTPTSKYLFKYAQQIFSSQHV